MQDMGAKFLSFCQGLEQIIFPCLEEGHALIQEYGAESIAEFKARIEAKMKEEAESWQLLIFDHESQLARVREEAQKKQEDLEAANQQLKKDLEAQKSELEATQKLLETHIYTEAEYAEGFENGWKSARRLAFHAAPDINWDQVEAWSMDPDNPCINEASQAEIDFLVRQAEADAREAEKAAKEVDTVRPASSSADAGPSGAQDDAEA
ncbi:uncharacterized protein LOC110725668 [Chenopodium quinoa]|uniref:uncharacterized protein LOC110725668 n=1 Tax=Chenopodium quinoa TaxID=63459 RepID=UPI000B784E98|nr:uncharacterized protein LOC110725668 [Chenopodium quinoa]